VIEDGVIEDGAIEDGVIEDGAWTRGLLRGGRGVGGLLSTDFGSGRQKSVFARGCADCQTDGRCRVVCSSVQIYCRRALPPIGQRAASSPGATRGTSRVAAVPSLPFHRAERSVLALRVPRCMSNWGRRSRAVTCDSSILPQSRRFPKVTFAEFSAAGVLVSAMGADRLFWRAPKKSPPSAWDRKSE
jgi:hypothetical protein